MVIIMYNSVTMNENHNSFYQESCYDMLRGNGYMIQFVKNQTYDMVKIAVETNPLALKYANEDLIDEKIIDICVNKYDGSDVLLEHIPQKYHTDKIILKLIKLNNLNAAHVSEDKYKMVVENIPQCIRAIKNLSRELILIAIENNVLPCVDATKFFTREEIKEFLKKDGKLIRWFNHRNDIELQKIAVMNNWEVLKYISDSQHFRVCKVAIDCMYDKEKSTKNFYKILGIIDDYHSGTLNDEKYKDRIYKYLIPYINKLILQHDQ